MQCCGVDDYTDYQKNEIFAREGKVIPESCCVLEGDPLKFKPLASTCTTSPNDVNSYYKKVGYFFVIIIHKTKTHSLFLGLFPDCSKFDHVKSQHRYLHLRRSGIDRDHWNIFRILLNKID